MRQTSIVSPLTRGGALVTNRSLSFFTLSSPLAAHSAHGPDMDAAARYFSQKVNEHDGWRVQPTSHCELRCLSIMAEPHSTHGITGVVGTASSTSLWLLPLPLKGHDPAFAHLKHGMSPEEDAAERAGGGCVKHQGHTW